MRVDPERRFLLPGDFRDCCPMLRDYALPCRQPASFSSRDQQRAINLLGIRGGSEAASRRGWRWLQMRLSTLCRSSASSTFSCRPALLTMTGSTSIRSTDWRQIMRTSNAY
jgi:hypothetical protein